MTILHVLGLSGVLPTIYVLHYIVTFSWAVYKAKKENKDTERYKKMLSDVKQGTTYNPL